MRNAVQVDEVTAGDQTSQQDPEESIDESSISTPEASAKSDGGAPPITTAQLFKIIQEQNAMVSELQKAVKMVSAKPTPESKVRGDTRPGSTISPLHRPHEIATPWSAHVEAKFLDAVSALIPSQMRELAENLKNANKTNALCVSLMHTTPGGLLNLVENDARTFSQKVALATDKGYVIPGPSATPLLDAAARLPVALWHKDKLADFLLAAVNYMLMLHSLVNPAFVAPLLVMVQLILSVYLGDHRDDWVHAVRVLEGVMKKDASDPSIWADQSSTYLAAIRRVGNDASKGEKPSGTPDAAARGAQDGGQAIPRLPPANPRCGNWNRGIRCADGVRCRYLHRCSICDREDHPASHCRGKGDQGKRDDPRDDRRERDDRRPHGRN